jgi:cell cycle checkpoint protein
MSRHIQRSNVPTVLIFSDVREGKHQPRDLERLIDPQYLYNSELVTIRQCNPVTKARMKKSLEAISKKEGIQVPAHFWEEVHMQSGGDLRHAIMALQFRGNDNDDVGGGDKKHHYERDSKLSMFHTLGKVLYAKRKKVPEVTNSNERPPLDFNPDAVMEQSGMDLGAALTFLGYHSPDFFTDVSEISKAFDHYSDAAVLLGRSVSSNELNTSLTFRREKLMVCLFVLANPGATRLQ